jgi:hypothetical protein
MAAVYKLTVIESTGTTFKHEPKDSSQLTNPDDKMAIPKGTSTTQLAEIGFHLKQ